MISCTKESQKDLIGYASSSRDGKDCTAAKITVLFADGFEYEQDSCETEIYYYHRDKHTITKENSEDNAHFGISYGVLESVYDLLRSEEMKYDSARKIRWEDNGMNKARIIKSELEDGVFMPLPHINLGCSNMCINVTSLFFDTVPKPLEASLLCDVLNMAASYSSVPVAAPFYNCYNSVYCSVDFVVPAADLFGWNLLRDFERGLENEIISGEIKGMKKLRIKRRDVISSFEKASIPEPVFSGNEHKFAVELKRDCIKYVCMAFKNAASQNNADSIHKISGFLKENIMRFRSLAQLFVLGENIYHTSDILYLTLYELIMSFAFYEKRLSLKKAVSYSRMRQASLGKAETPDIIYPDGSVR